MVVNVVWLDRLESEIMKPYSINLSEQMATCDANYIRILKLLENGNINSKREIAFPAIGSMEQRSIIEVVEKFKYTSTIKISQHVKSDSDEYQPPEMLVRMYHDANTAEVISYQSQRGFKSSYQLPNKEMRAPDEKQQLNMFLAEWLKVCLDEGLCLETKLPEEYFSVLSKET